MTDYLQEALEGGEETAALIQGRRALLPRRPGPAPTPPEAEPAPQASSAGAFPVPAEGESGEESWSGDLPGREARGEAGTWLLAALGRAGRARRALRQGPGAVTVPLPGPGEAPAAGETDLESLDLALQRDARRYDGGFPLY